MPNSKKARLIIFYWFPVFLWCSFIFYLSSIPDLRSDLPNAWDYVFRKLAHITEYAVLAFLFFRAASRNMSRRRALAYGALFAFTFSLTDEYHQTFVSGRSGNLVDAAIDSLGILFAIFAIDKIYLDVSLRSRK
jgi:VanZ family protein